MKYAVIAITFCVAVVAAIYVTSTEEVVRQQAGVLCPKAPIQKPLQNATPFLKGDYMITPLAEFDMHGRVLSKEGYSWGEEANLSPVDLANARNVEGQPI